MAHQVVWLEAALDDVQAIAEHIAESSPAYASVVVERLLTLSRDVGVFPWMGRCVPEWGDDIIRERLVYAYRLIYRVERDHITILAVIHGARLLPDDFKKRT